MAGHSGEMIGDVLYMLWISAAAVLLGLLIRAAFRRVKKEIRRKERERLEREGRIIFREKIDDVDIPSCSTRLLPASFLAKALKELPMSAPSPLKSGSEAMVTGFSIGFTLRGGLPFCPASIAAWN